jgi:hypothetical protein
LAYTWREAFSVNRVQSAPAAFRTSSSSQIMPFTLDNSSPPTQFSTRVNELQLNSIDWKTRLATPSGAMSTSTESQAAGPTRERYFHEGMKAILEKLWDDPKSITAADAQNLADNSEARDVQTAQVVAAVKHIASFNEFRKSSANEDASTRSSMPNAKEFPDTVITKLLNDPTSISTEVRVASLRTLRLETLDLQGWFRPSSRLLLFATIFAGRMLLLDRHLTLRCSPSSEISSQMWKTTPKMLMRRFSRPLGLLPTVSVLSALSNLADQIYSDFHTISPAGIQC